MQKTDNKDNSPLACLRSAMCKNGVDAYYIVSEDYHSSEYVQEYFRQREYFSGFTGSAGSLLVLPDRAYLWTDGRYFIQAEKELDGSGITLMRMGEEQVPTPKEFMEETLKPSMVLMMDGRTITDTLFHQLTDTLIAKGVICSIGRDLAGEVWENNGRPQLQFHKIDLWEDRYAGESCHDKLHRLREFLIQNKMDYYIFTALDDIAWILNLRGNDVLCNPVFLSYFIVGQKTASLYCMENCLTTEAEKLLSDEKICVKSYFDFYSDIERLHGVVGADEDKTNIMVTGSLEENKNVQRKAIISPVTLWKSIKNEVEISGEKKCHILDGVAFVNFMYWLKHCSTDKDGYLLDEHKNRVTEISAAIRLEEERKKQENYAGPSFEPIVAVGAHGAIVHYSASEHSNAALRCCDPVLMDTGGQYFYGTTDITRTLVFTKPDSKFCELYTAVLRGNLLLQDAVFKKGSRGENLDILARRPLWELGYDFNHGTGHGVGCFLNVHEGPNNIRNRIIEGKTPSAVLEPGMITSDEPGVYLEDQFGIRLENMILCKMRQQTEYGTFLEFEPLTLVPWERDAILPEKMTEHERKLLNSYHQKVYNTLAPYLCSEVTLWLKEITKPI